VHTSAQELWDVAGAAHLHDLKRQWHSDEKEPHDPSHSFLQARFAPRPEVDFCGLLLLAGGARLRAAARGGRLTRPSTRGRAGAIATVTISRGMAERPAGRGERGSEPMASLICTTGRPNERMWCSLARPP
jgi:hypothetical protein